MAPETIAAIGTIIASAFAFIISWQTANNSARKDSFSQLQAVVVEQQKFIDKLKADTKEQIEALKDNIAELECENSKLRDRISKTESESRDWRDWAEELAGQLKEARIQPVPFRRRRGDA